MKLLFGQYKGRDLRNVPAEYLRWLLSRDIDDYLRGGIEETLRQWDSQKRPAKKTHTPSQR